MPKYILKTDGTLQEFNDEGNVVETTSVENYAVSKSTDINKIRNVRSGLSALDYTEIGLTPSNSNVKTNKILNVVDNFNLSGSLGQTTNYVPFNSFTDFGDDADNTFAFANLDSKYQLNSLSPLGNERQVFGFVLVEFFTIFISSFLTAAAFETLYGQWKEDVRSKTDLTLGKNRQFSSSNILDNIVNILHAEANWPKTKSGANAALVTGLLMDLTNTDVVRSVKELDDDILTGLSLGFPLSFITLFANNVIDALFNSQDVFNRVKLRLRRIALDSAYKRFIKSSPSTVNTNQGFTSFVNSYYFKYIIERINVGELLLVKYVLGDHPLGHNVDTRYLPDSALTRLIKSKKGPNSNTIGHESTSPLSIHQLPGLLNVGHEIQRAIALDNNSKLEDLGDLVEKFKVRTRSDTASRFNQEDVKKLEDKLEAEYVPFYFQDLRNNEIMAFHAFIESISDSFNPSFNETDGYGRIESVKTYNKTTRNISINFTLAAMNPDDHDYMWFCVNRLVAMCYPQWSKGSKTAGGFTQPFSQIPTSSPVIRMRLGDVIKSNYSRKNLARLFGVGDDDFSFNEVRAGSENPQFAEAVERTGGEDEAKRSKQAPNVKRNPSTEDNPASLNIVDQNKSLRDEGLKRKSINLQGSVFIMPGVYSLDTNAVTQFLGGALGVKATLPNNNTFGRSYYKVNDYIEGTVEETNTLNQGLFFGPSDSGKTHDSYFKVKLKSDLTKTLLVPKDAIIFKDVNSNKITLDGSKDLTDVFMKPNNTDGTKIYNPIVKAFETSRGRGLAGVITQLDYNYNDSTWETSRIGSKAPQFMRVQLTFSPIHDIPMGLDHKGFMRAPAYPVGRVNRTFFGEVYDAYNGDNFQIGKGNGLASAISEYEKLEKDYNDKT